MLVVGLISAQRASDARLSPDVTPVEAV